jgi:hypothetical protein
MNFSLPDGALAADGTECNEALHWPSDPCTWLMPELRWVYSYVVLGGVALLWVLVYSSFVLRKFLKERREIVVAESGVRKT